MSSSASGLTFVDASGWIALVNRNDGLHQQAARLFQQRLDEGKGFVTSSVVLLEVGNWLSPVTLRPLASRLWERIEHSQRIEVVELTSELGRKGWQLYGQRADKGWGAIDCISFIIMQERNLLEALTGDRHFQQAGFRVLL
jgi:predicted nucleic acid-binding protein